jgi:hypothetical protein
MSRFVNSSGGRKRLGRPARPWAKHPDPDVGCLLDTMIRIRSIVISRFDQSERGVATLDGSSLRLGLSRANAGTLGAS